MYKPSHGILGSAEAIHNNKVTPYTYEKDILQQKYVREHIITLSSEDRRHGSTLTNAVFDINKPVEITGQRAVMFVDKFLVDKDLANEPAETLVKEFIYNIHIPELMQPLSYSSYSGGNTDVVLSWKGHVYQSQSRHGCIPIVDRGLFRSKQVTVKINSRGLDMSLWTQAWTLVLVVQEEIYE